jgi:hypothetical protein
LLSIYKLKTADDFAERIRMIGQDPIFSPMEIVVPDEDIEYEATNKLEKDGLERVKGTNFAWAIENYPHGVKQYCLIEGAQVRSGRGLAQSYQPVIAGILARGKSLLSYRADVGRGENGPH